MIKLIKNTFYHETWTKIRLAWFILWARQLSFGEKCQQFEREFAKWQGRGDAVFVNSGSSANLAILQALLNLGRLRKGDKVGFSALGWSTTVMPIIELGLEPVPVDIDPKTLNAHWFIPPSVQCMFVTHLLGNSCPIEDMKALAVANEQILIEDSCESLGSEYLGKKLGNFGLASTFSFYVGHHMSTIEGGMIATDDPELARELRIVRAHGWDRNLDTRTQTELRKAYKTDSTFYSRYTFYSLGYNLRPTEIAGFLGLLQLPYLEKIIEKRRHIYRELTKGITKYQLMNTNDLSLFSPFSLPIICKSKKDRDELVKKCERLIEVRPIVGGDLTQQPFYKNKTICPNAKKIHDRGLYIGINPDMTNTEIQTIRKVLL